MGVGVGRAAHDTHISTCGTSRPVQEKEMARKGCGCTGSKVPRRDAPQPKPAVGSFLSHAVRVARGLTPYCVHDPGRRHWFDHPVKLGQMWKCVGHNKTSENKQNQSGIQGLEPRAQRRVGEKSTWRLGWARTGVLWMQPHNPCRSFPHPPSCPCSGSAYSPTPPGLQPLAGTA